MSLLPTRKLTCLWGGKKEARLRIVTYEGEKVHLLFSLERSIYKLFNCDVQGTVGITRHIQLLIINKCLFKNYLHLTTL